MGELLLVEDDAAVADVLRRMLARAGYAVRIASDGLHALTALSQETPTVLILDLILPGVSGYTILEHILKQHIPTLIVVITANPLHHDALHHLGIKHVLVKPFSIEELLDALSAAHDQDAAVKKPRTCSAVFVLLGVVLPLV